MPAPERLFAVRSKVWIQDNKGNVVFGMGRYRMLASIRQTGSLNATAKELKMSYRAVWMRIRMSEERIGKALVEKQGNGSRLTPFAEQLVAQFERLQSQVKNQSDDFYTLLMSDSLAER